jgi:hypothetical protein
MLSVYLLGNHGSGSVVIANQPSRWDLHDVNLVHSRLDFDTSFVLVTVGVISDSRIRMCCLVGVKRLLCVGRCRQVRFPVWWHEKCCLARSEPIGDWCFANWIPGLLFERYESENICW